jgi:hypothetical protein
MEIIILANMFIFGHLCYRVIHGIYDRRGLHIILKERIVMVCAFLAGAILYGGIMFLLKNVNAPQLVLIAFYIMPVAFTAFIIRDL